MLTKERLKEEGEEYKESAKKQAKRLVEIKKAKKKAVDVEIVDDWELDYEED